MAARSKVDGNRSKRQKSGGRKRGTPNRLTRDERTLLAIVVNYGLERAQGWLERVARKHPARALALTAKFAEFVVPRLQRTELRVSEHPDIGAVPITVEAVLEAWRAPAASLAAPQPQPQRASSPAPASSPEALATLPRGVDEPPPAAAIGAPEKRGNGASENAVLEAEPDASGAWSVQQEPPPPPSPWPKEWAPNPAAKYLTAEELETKRDEIQRVLGGQR
ncbi:MAG TPA: hypothetical protein VK676_14570 [Steroidobacteraceae bacterium]|nr:hypothetical protein [Steroidobacteraceae bacterium]